MKTKKQNVPLALLLTFAMLALIFSGCSAVPEQSQVQDGTASQNQVSPGEQTDSFKVSLDVNPSIEFTVTDGLVSAVKAYNDDGTEIELETDVMELNAAEAVTVIVQQMISAGFISVAEIEPYLLITVSEDEELDPETAEMLIALLEDAANLALSENEVSCKVKSTITSDDVKSESEALGLSIGRYLLFSYIALEEEITIEEALLTYGHLSIGEIIEIFEDAEFAFKYQETNENDNIDEEQPDSEFEGLDPEQKEALQPAIDQLKLELKTARETFQEAFKNVKETYKDGLEGLRTEGKKENPEDLKSQRTLLRETMLEQRKLAIENKKTAYVEAKENFVATALELGIPAEVLSDFIEDLVEEEETMEEETMEEESVEDETMEEETVEDESVDEETSDDESVDVETSEDESIEEEGSDDESIEEESYGDGESKNGQTDPLSFRKGRK